MTFDSSKDFISHLHRAACSKSHLSHAWAVSLSALPLPFLQWITLGTVVFLDQQEVKVHKGPDMHLVGIECFSLTAGECLKHFRKRERDWMLCKD